MMSNGFAMRSPKFLKSIADAARGNYPSPLWLYEACRQSAEKAWKQNRVRAFNLTACRRLKILTKFVLRLLIISKAARLLISSIKIFPDIITLFGDEHDVLARYHHAAQTLNADIIMRITSDCPLIDANLCNAMMKIFQTHDYDYFSNSLICSFPHGLDAEIMWRDGLEQAYANATTAYAREHVSPWLQDNPSLKFGCMVNLDADRDLVSQRWTLDYQEDLGFFR